LDGLKRVIQASQRARDLVNQILTFSRRQQHQRSPIQLHAIVEEALKLLRPSLPATIEIRTRLQPEAPLVLADSTQLHQVLMNLATNAASSMAEHPQLRCGRFVRLVVSDTGCGMDAATRERIFEPFFTTKAPGQGTGLGLAVVHGIIQQHEGAIVVYSERDKGTTFQVYLPVCETATEATRPGPLQPPPRGRGEMVMVVDDEELVLRVAVGMLRHLGYRTAAYGDGATALQALREKPMDFDLVMTDLTMPKMTGAMLAAEIRRLRPDIPIVLCTGFGKAMDPEDIIHLKLRGPLLKPFMLETLASIAAEALHPAAGPDRAPPDTTSSAGG
jgi:CheY-like chemotaxis protein/two-component sensor histidine kinase